MTLTEQLSALQQPSVAKTQPCVVYRSVTSHPEYSPAVEVLIADLLWAPTGGYRVTTVDLVDKLNDLGIYVSETSLRLHRKKACTCFRRTHGK